MLSNDTQNDTTLPLAGCRVIERSRTVAAAYAGRLLAAMGAQVGAPLIPEQFTGVATPSIRAGFRAVLA